MSRGRKLLALLYGAIVLGALASPALRDPPYDSFPLSNYPMFSHGRPDPHFVLTHALGVNEAGERVPLSPSIAAGTLEVLQSMMTISLAVNEGRGPALCGEIAGRVADAEMPFVAVELATSRFHTLDYFDGSPEPLARQVHHHCEVPR